MASHLDESQAIRIAVEYGHAIGLANFEVEGALMDDSGPRPTWLVYLGFLDLPRDAQGEVLLGLPSWVQIEVDAETGNPSILMHL